MKKIYKYKLPRDGEIYYIEANVIQWLNVQEQNGWPHIWAIVDLNGKTRKYAIAAWGTGWEFPDELEWFSYLGTAQDGAGFVWHYFMKDVTEENSYDYAAATIDLNAYNPYEYESLSNPCNDYSITISCGEPVSSVSALETKAYSNCSTTIDSLQSIVEYLTATVADGKTAATKACQ